MSHEEESRMDREVLAATFQARVKLARQERGAAAKEADTEWLANRTWFSSSNKAPGSFLWFCDAFDLEPSAVRKQVGL
jgi:hypothetical protein